MLAGFILAFVGTTLFALKSIFIKFIYAQGLDANTVLVLRMVISLPFYLIVLAYLHHKKKIAPSKIKPNLALIALLGFLGYFLASLLDLKGLEYISASLERLALFIYPTFVAILSYIFFAEKITLRVLLSLLLSYTGLLIAFNTELSFNPNTLIGISLVIMSAISFAFYVVFAAKVIKSLGSLQFTAIAMSISSMFSILYYLIFFSLELSNVNSIAWFWLVVLSIFSTVLPSFLISAAIKRVGPVYNSIIGSLGPIITIFVAVIILDELFNYSHLVALILIISGISLLTIKNNRQ